MKKLITMFIIFAACIITTGCTGEDVKNSAIENYSSSSASKQVLSNDAWTATFQLCWNEFIELVGTKKIEYVDGNPPLADELNKQLFTKKDLSEDSYYVSVTKQTLKHKKEIEKAIKEKFNEKSDILDSFEFADVADNSTNEWFIYSILLKNFKFVKPYSILDSQYFNDDKTQEYKFFGYTNLEEDKKNQSLRESHTESLFYANDNDFAVKFIDKNEKEEMILYLTDSDKSFDSIYLEMLEKSANKEKYTEKRIEDLKAQFKHHGGIKYKNYYKIPFMHIDEMYNFDKELAGKLIKGKTYKSTGLTWQILKTLQTIKFDLDNEGAKLKSEAAMSVMKMSLAPQSHIEIIDYYYFNRPFVIFLKEKDKEKPYFAARVKDGKYLVKDNK